MTSSAIRVFYHPGFAAPLGNHKMPIQKFALVAQSLENDPAIELIRPEPVLPVDLLRVHDPVYIEAVRTGNPRALAESQKFPWSPELYPSVLLTNGGVLAAAKECLQAGYSAALASGFHHSGYSHGEGFCTFNGLIVALDKLKSEGNIKSAAILDMDLHYGNGTAQLVGSRPWVRALSIYGNDYLDNTPYRDVTVLKHQDGVNHQSAALPEGCEGHTQLAIMEANFSFLLGTEKPDLLLYQAGADPYFEDPYSPLKLTHEDLLARDRRVFEFAKSNQIPIAWVLAGGYTQDISKIIQVHLGTFQAWKEVFLAS
jgi:acetoin utilization deacetylase AcuC-like enzyme